MIEEWNEDDVEMPKEIDKWGPMDVDSQRIFLATKDSFIIPKPKQSARETVLEKFWDYLKTFEKEASEIPTGQVVVDMASKIHKPWQPLPVTC